MNNKKLTNFQLYITIFSIAINYYLPFSGIESFSVLIIFIITNLLLFSLNPICSFFFCYIISVNLFDNFAYLWSGLVILIFSNMFFFIELNTFRKIFKNNKLKKITILSLVFSFLMVFNLISKNALSLSIFFENFKLIFGFLFILPTYFFASKYLRDLFKLLITTSLIFLIVYFFNLFFKLNLFIVFEGETSIDSKLNRFMGYDLRQFIILFIYLIPALYFSNIKSFFFKSIIIGIGLGAFFVIILAVYRLAIFYNTCGLILAFLFSIPYQSKKKIFYLLFLLLSIPLLGILIFNQYLIEFISLFFNSLNYFSGNIEDSSADTRFITQIPLLFKEINDNLILGCGLVKANNFTKDKMFAFVDIPLFGSIATYGILGISVYFIRSIYILKSNFHFSVLNINSFNESNKLIFYLYNSLKAYLITMITFRLFYINWELSFDWMQPEFGLIVGVFLSLEYKLKNILKFNIT